MDSPASSPETSRASTDSLQRSGSDERAARAAERPLVHTKGISHPAPSDPAEKRCKRWPEHLALKSSRGQYVRGRCRSTNRCTYCARQFAFETAELLTLDALTAPPTCWLVLTTRTATLDVSTFWRGFERTMRAVRRRWPEAEYASLVEFTTGYGPRSGGSRRPHWNVLLKGVPAGQIDELRTLVLRVWCGQVDAEPVGQWIDTVHATGGLSRYVALHFLKESQAPPEGWRGHRFRRSRGYFDRPMPELRREARLSLALRRKVYALSTEHPDVPEDVLYDRAQRFLEENAATTWKLVQILKLGRDHDRERAKAAAAPFAWLHLSNPRRDDVNPSPRSRSGGGARAREGPPGAPRG